MTPEATYVLESLATIAVFGGALYAASWGVRRLTGPRGRGPLEVLARQPLDGRRAIYLVRVGKRVLIVGSSDGALTRLGSTTFAAIESELEAPPEGGKTFRDVLSRAVSSKKE
jgi:flagellar biogenesis protein FliO